MMDVSSSPMRTRSMISKLSDKIGDMAVSVEHNEIRWNRDVKRRLKALKKLEYETIKREVTFYERLQDLERQFQEEITPFEQRRSDIINGVLHPTDDESSWSSDESSDSDEASSSAPKTDDAEIKWIPNFWLTLLEGKTFLVDPIQEHDRPVLKHLTNIRAIYLQRGSRLEFTFSPNEYFANTVLCKEYHIDLSPSTIRGKKLSYYGPRNVAVFGCPISWKENMDVTKIPYSKDMINGGFKDSFFNMFGRSGVLGPDIDDDLNCTLEAEFSLCRLLQQNILPRAASIYSHNYYNDILEDLDDDDEMYDEEADDDYDPRLE